MSVIGRQNGLKERARAIIIFVYGIISQTAWLKEKHGAGKDRLLFEWGI